MDFLAQALVAGPDFGAKGVVFGTGFRSQVLDLCTEFGAEGVDVGSEAARGVATRVRTRETREDRPGRRVGRWRKSTSAAYSIRISMTGGRGSRSIRSSGCGDNGPIEH